MQHENVLITFFPETLSFEWVTPVGTRRYEYVVRQKNPPTVKRVGRAILSGGAPVCECQKVTLSLLELEKTGTPIVPGTYIATFNAGNTCSAGDTDVEFQLTEEMVQKLTSGQPTAPSPTPIKPPAEPQTPPVAQPQQESPPPVATPSEPPPAEAQPQQQTVVAAVAEATNTNPPMEHVAPEATKIQEESPMSTSTKLQLNLTTTKTSEGIVLSIDLQQVPQATLVAIDLHEAGQDGVPLKKEANWGDVYDVPADRKFSVNITGCTAKDDYLLKPGNYVIAVYVHGDKVEIGQDFVSIEVKPEDSVPAEEVAPATTPASTEPVPAPTPAAAVDSSVAAAAPAATETPKATAAPAQAETATPAAVQPATVVQPEEVIIKPVSIDIGINDTSVVGFNVSMPDGVREFTFAARHVMSNTIPWPAIKNKFTVGNNHLGHVPLRHVHQDHEVAVIPGVYEVTIMPLDGPQGAKLESLVGTFNLTEAQAEVFKPKTPPAAKPALPVDRRALTHKLGEHMPVSADTSPAPAPAEGSDVSAYKPLFDVIILNDHPIFSIRTNDPTPIKEFRIKCTVKGTDTVVFEEVVPVEGQLTRRHLKGLFWSKAEELDPKGQEMQISTIAIGHRPKEESAAFAIFLKPETVAHILASIKKSKDDKEAREKAQKEVAAAEAATANKWANLTARLTAMGAALEKSSAAQAATAAEIAQTRQFIATLVKQRDEIWKKLQEKNAGGGDVPDEVFKNAEAQIERIGQLVSSLKQLLEKADLTHKEIIAAKDQILAAQNSLNGLEERLAKIVEEAAHKAVTKAMAPVVQNLAGLPAQVRAAASDGASAGAAIQAARLEAAAQRVEAAAAAVASAPHGSPAPAAPVPPVPAVPQPASPAPAPQGSPASAPAAAVPSVTVPTIVIADNRSSGWFVKLGKVIGFVLVMGLLIALVLTFGVRALEAIKG